MKRTKMSGRGVEPSNGFLKKIAKYMLENPKAARRTVANHFGVTSYTITRNNEKIKLFLKQEQKLQKAKQLNVSVEEVSEAGLDVVTEDFLEKLKCFRVCGYSLDKCARLLGISRTTLYRYQKDFPEVASAIDDAMDINIAEVTSALLNRAKGMKVKRKHFAHHQGEIYSEEYVETVLPDVRAINSFLLNNKKGWRINDTQAAQFEETEGILLKAIKSRLPKPDQGDSDGEE